MKKVLTFAILIFASVLTFACKDGAKAQPNEPEQKEAKSGEVIVMNKDMFIKDVFDYEKSQDWKYKGDKPAIIDLYADWCVQEPLWNLSPQRPDPGNPSSHACA